MSTETSGRLDALLKKRFDMPRLNGNQTKDTIAKFNQQADESERKLKSNPFSDDYRIQDHKKSDRDYGRPTHGSLTERRGIAAGNHVGKEILELCQVVNDCGYQRPDGRCIMTFGQLFSLYTKISDKVVGMLLRARKHGLVEFEGEMLYQRRDEHVVITLLKSIDEIKAGFNESGDPASCLKKR